MKIKIVTDSTCDLPVELLERYEITVLPLHITKGDESLLAGIEITPLDIFRYVDGGGAICTTAAVNITEYQRCFAKLCPCYDAVIVMTISAEFSGCFQNAQAAAADYPNVAVIDSCSLSCGQGMIVLEAAEMAEQGLPPDEIAAELRRRASLPEASFLLDRLDYMQKGGRCSSATALGANLLHLKPCIEVRDGKMTVGKKYRGTFPKTVYQYASERLSGRTDIRTDRVFIAHPDADPEAVKAAVQAIQEYGQFSEIWLVRGGCTVSCHCGPNTVGVMFMRKG